MRILVSILLLLLAGAGQAQVINGESTDDAAYAPRPPARWHSPEASGAVPGDRPDDDAADQGVRTEMPHR